MASRSPAAPRLQGSHLIRLRTRHLPVGLSLPSCNRGGGLLGCAEDAELLAQSPAQQLVSLPGPGLGRASQAEDPHGHLGPGLRSRPTTSPLHSGHSTCGMGRPSVPGERTTEGLRKRGHGEGTHGGHVTLEGFPQGHRVARLGQGHRERFQMKRLFAPLNRCLPHPPISSSRALLGLKYVYHT